MNRAATRAATALLVVASAWSPAALAFRPFDGTDAAVADPGSVEVELEPAGYLREGSERSLIAPALRLNYGFAEQWEAVLEGEAVHGLARDVPRASLVENAVSVKHVIRDGSLQEKPGPSVATELSLLLPGINDEPGLGASLAGIVSQRWPWVTLHLNIAGAVTRQQHGDLFTGLIIEGPQDWAVRPVAEIFSERDFGRLTTNSGLIGAIWRLRDALAFDAALRHARVDGRSLDELRAGVTFSFQVR